MIDDDIQRIIDFAVIYKRKGEIEKALDLEIECLERCKTDNNTSNIGFGMLYKSIGKLFYIKEEFIESKQCLCNAIFFYSKENNNFTYECLFHLGCCHEEFLKSRIAKEYLQVLKTGKGPGPGEPGSLISPDRIVELTNIGIITYNSWFDEIS